LTPSAKKRKKENKKLIDSYVKFEASFVNDNGE